MKIDPRERNLLLKLSADALRNAVLGHPPPSFPDKYKRGVLVEHLGAFVTLRRGNELRGCIGRFESGEELWKLIISLTRSSALHDSRFSPVASWELPEISIEISMLTPMRRVNDISEIIPGKHGLYISKGGKSGTLLPQVAVANGWSVDEFLGHTSRDKANIGWEGWRDADIYTYEAEVFGDK